MGTLTDVLGRLTALVVATALSDLMMPPGKLKQCVQFVTGLLIVETVLSAVLALPALLS